MSPISDLYHRSLTLLTDLYQLTMAYAYWKTGLMEHEAAFHLTFRHNPFEGGFTVACGLETALDFLRNFRFDDDDAAYLATLRGNDERPLFEPAFLDYLKSMRLTCNVDAIPEGTVVFPHEPLIRVTGPLLQAQLLETPLLNIINFQTLVATKAARVCSAAGDKSVVEFGLRRAQGIDGALSASRAAYVGGCHATSNVLAGRLMGIPVAGTHAHSWVMAFDREQDAFDAYAEAMPNNCVLLVDTYDTLEGIQRAIATGKQLRQRGHEMIGVRLDSGDLAYLSAEARRMLDENGFPNASIIASNDLDERIIESLQQQGARIDTWGVGTKLVTAFDQPALGGVYKLTALRAPDKPWRYTVKLSEQAIKTSTPGILQVRRFTDGKLNVADVVYDTQAPPADGCVIVDPLDMTRRKGIDRKTPYEDLLVPVVRGGTVAYTPPALAEIRRRVSEQLSRFHAGIKRFVNPHQYPVGLERGLHVRKTELILRARGAAT